MSQYSEKQKKKTFLLLSLFSNLGILCFFKYFNFFMDNLAQMAKLINYEFSFVSLNIVLPVGISFYTLQTLSYTIDVYKGKTQPEKNFLDFANYVSFFPQLVAGPIERAGQLLPQLKKLSSPTTQQIQEGLFLISLGFFKKVIISDNIAPIADAIFLEPQAYTSYDLWLGVFVFALQIYFDFSGYSKIARGLARFFGINLSMNFNQPYFSQNPAEFWNRWHISLSHWIRDYIFFPLAKNIRKKYQLYFITLLSLLIIGLWHGASWNFILFGLCAGLLIVSYRLMNEVPPIRQLSLRTPAFVNMILAQFFLLFPIFVFFRSTDIATSMVYLQGMLTYSPLSLEQAYLPLFLMLILFIVDFPIYKTKDEFLFLKLQPPIRYFVYGLIFLFTLAFLFNNLNHERPFIYFQF